MLFLVISCDDDEKDCSGHGTCYNNRCACNAGWDSQSDCSSKYSNNQKKRHLSSLLVVKCDNLRVPNWPSE